MYCIKISIIQKVDFISQKIYFLNYIKFMNSNKKFKKFMKMFFLKTTVKTFEVLFQTN